MSEAYIGEIRIFAGNFAPLNWSFCDGSLLAISEYEALFTLIGTTYGGDGIQTFALPDLRGRIPYSFTSHAPLGLSSGTETVTLLASQMPAHNHLLEASISASQNSPIGNFFGTNPTVSRYADDNGSDTGLMGPAVLGFTGGNQPHNNIMPSLCINYIISLFGIYPSFS